MSEIKHTPTPWKVVSEPHFDSGLVYTSIQPVHADAETMKPLAMANGEYHICRMSHTAAEWRFNYHRRNAEFIVTAVNSYATLTARIEALEAENERLRAASWRPISEADKGIAHILDAAGLHIGNSLPIWARDSDGRVFECLWADDGKRAYWWDTEGESPVDPVEFMPHPLDPRFGNVGAIA